MQAWGFSCCMIESLKLGRACQKSAQSIMIFWHIEVSTPKRFVVLLFNAYNYIYSIQNTLAAVINYLEAIIKQTKQCIIYQNS